MREAVGRILFPARNAETLAWRAAVVSDGGSVSNQRLLRVDKLISTLKGAGVWTNLDRLWLFAAENSQSALRDIVAASAATATNSPTFAANLGYTGNGTTTNINSNFNASSAPSPKMSQDGVVAFVFNLSSGQSAAPAAFGTTVNFNTGIFSRDATDTELYRTNSSGANLSNTTTDGSGLMAINRSAAAAMQAYKNGVSVASSAAASVALVNGNFVFLQASSSNGNMQLACGGFGSSLDATGHGALYRAIRTCLTAVGVP